MNVKCFYGGLSKSKPNHAPVKFPVQNSEISDDSDLLTDSDEEINLEIVECGDLYNETDEEIVLTDTEDEDWDDQSDKIDCLLPQHKKTSKKTLKSDLVWKKENPEDILKKNLQYQNDNEIDSDLDIVEPIQYVKRFLSDQMLQLIVDESNKYAIQKNPNKPLQLDKNELEQFIGILYAMSIVQMPSTRMYWSKELYFEKIGEVMTVNRFEQIKLFFHCNDNNKFYNNCGDKLYKVRPIINMLKDSFSKLKHEEMLCVDEQVVPYKGKSSIKQYNPMKPKKWGFKIYVLSGVDGLVHNFEIHTGPIDVCPGQPDLKASGNIVMNLLVNVPRQKWHKLYFDNWYTSLELVKSLFTQGIACVGTVRSNRLKNIELPTDKVMKKQGRGSATLLTTNIDNVELRVVKWFDNRGVTLLSSYEAVNPVSTVQRWDRKTKSKINVTRPSIVSTYNSFMGGVDLLDCLLSLYRIQIRSKKWYHKLIWHFLDMIIVQAWIIYCRDMKKSNALKKDIFQLRVFKLKVANDLMKAGKVMVKNKRGRSSKTVENLLIAKRKKGPVALVPEFSTRTDRIDHWPVFSEKKGRCKNPGCDGIPKVYCDKCKVHLCFTPKSNCFTDFHK
jgi:hypothetical protein